MLKSTDELIIIVDSREFKSKVAKVLYEQGAKLVNQQLVVGDYVVSDRVVIERKSGSDFVKSIIDGRVFKQAEELVDNFDRPIIIIEGSCNNINVHPNAVRGAIASLTTDFGIPLINVEDSNEAALQIIAYARREQTDSKRPVTYAAKRKGLTDNQLIESIISSFPNFGPQIAKNLLTKFKTIKNVINASEDDLIQVDKIGKLKAKRFNELVNKEY